MKREFKVRVYEDHYLITAEQGAGTIAAEKGALEAILAMQEGISPKPKRKRGPNKRKALGKGIGEGEKAE